MRTLPYVTCFALLVSAGACAPELDLEPAPELGPRIEEFADPTADVVASVMAAVSSDLAATRDDVESSSFYMEVIDLVVDVQNELYDEDGELKVGDLAFESPNGGVTVDYICDGWGETAPAEPDPANGNIRLNMRLTSGSIAPLVWGGLEDCRYPLQVGNQRLDALYDGAIALFFSTENPEDTEGQPLDSNTDPFSLEVFVAAAGSVELEGRSTRIEDFFSVTFVEDDGEVKLDELKVLVQLSDGTTFVYGFSFSTLRQELTDRTGTFRCSLEDRFCEAPSGTFSW